MLATSLALADYQAKQIVAFYQTRTQIEEKTGRYGLGLNGSQTTQRARWTTLLLIAALVHMALWLLGLATIQAPPHYPYQANTTRHRLGLSAITLGRHVMQRGGDRLPASVLRPPCVTAT